MASTAHEVARSAHPSVAEPALRRGAFALGWAQAINNGLVVVPTKAEDAKRPWLTKYAQQKRPPRASTCEKWANRWRDANIACVPGASDAVVIDWDDKATAHRVEEIFGPAAVVIETRRGFQFWYYFKGGIPSRDLRSIGLECEVKSRRVLVVLPGSIHPISGQPYRFARGSWADFSRLTEFNVAAYGDLTGRPVFDEQPKHTDPTKIKGQNPNGTRNQKTFRYLRNLGASGTFSSYEDLLSTGLEYDARVNNPPFGRQEVEKVCGSVWKYIVEGKCKPSKSAPRFSMPTQEEFEALRSLGDAYGNAAVLFIELKSRWGYAVSLGQPFPISPSQMAKAEVIPGWRDKKKYLGARRTLECVGLIKRISWARMGECAAQFTFGRGTSK